MAIDNLVQNENAVYHALKDGPATEAQIRKSTKLSDEEVAEFLQDWHLRTWISRDDEGKDTKYALTDQGRRDMQTRYQ